MSDTEPDIVASDRHLSGAAFEEAYDMLLDAARGIQRAKNLDGWAVAVIARGVAAQLEREGG